MKTASIIQHPCHQAPLSLSKRGIKVCSHPSRAMSIFFLNKNICRDYFEEENKVLPEIKGSEKIEML
jgi:hypothetical protein